MKNLAFGLGLISFFLSAGATGFGQLPANAPVVAAQAQARQPYPSFGSDLLDRQIHIYQQFLAAGGPPDILIVGSSRALQGVDPVALQMAMAHHGYPGLRVFNFSINGATAQVVELLLRKILIGTPLPKAILWADGLRAFNSGREDRTYQAIVASRGYQLLAQGVRPFQNSPIASTPPTAPPTSATYFRIQTTANNDPRAAITSTYKVGRQWWDTVQDELAATYQRQQETVTWWPGYEPPPLPTLEQIIAGEAPNQLQPTGFIPITTRYNPATYYQQYPRVPGNYDGDYINFNLEGPQKAALESVAAFARTRRIPLIIVNLPLTDDYLDPVRTNYEAQFSAQMERLAIGQGFIFRDLVRQWPAQDEYFQDPSHINRYGAFAVALSLAQDDTITWFPPQR
ncbi:MAG TPA: hypothetical protein IGS52_21500 [Oscillatoriaceae cyanobacterium M33_DOE_052]|nr:hypothetical protein [Oscillatoriaceae cyanobacterium M33_DOE_052]